MLQTEYIHLKILAAKVSNLPASAVQPIWPEFDQIGIAANLVDLEKNTFAIFEEYSCLGHIESFCNFVKDSLNAL